MRRITFALAALGAATALTFGGAGGSYAAVGGEFIYTNPTTGLETIDNPRLGHCYTVTGDGRAQNNTSKTALLFERPGCVGSHAEVIRPHTGAFDVQFASLEFID
ncbi:hypothetical protein [Streptomyces sp. NPDC088554]|uniref:hypothetical protein n=1 Tax=Streptomyces sp. NPDC088554 TaxID=3365865 RepID=UPI0037F1BED4